MTDNYAQIVRDNLDRLYKNSLDVRQIAEVVLTLSRTLLADKELELINEIPEDFFRTLSHPAETLQAQDIEKMIGERNTARAEKKWKDADIIRDRLKDMGVILEDGPEGTTWRFDV